MTNKCTKIWTLMLTIFLASASAASTDAEQIHKLIRLKLVVEDYSGKDLRETFTGTFFKRSTKQRRWSCGKTTSVFTPISKDPRLQNTTLRAVTSKGQTKLIFSKGGTVHQETNNPQRANDGWECHFLVQKHLTSKVSVHKVYLNELMMRSAWLKNLKHDEACKLKINFLAIGKTKKEKIKHKKKLADNISRQLHGEPVDALTYAHFAYLLRFGLQIRHADGKPVIAQKFEISSGHDGRYGLSEADLKALERAGKAHQLHAIRNYAWQWSTTHINGFKRSTPQQEFFQNTKLRDHIGRKFALLHYETLNGKKPDDEVLEALQGMTAI